jgi:Heterokaryon incompatibility protein (HET)
MGSLEKRHQIKDSHQVARRHGYIGELPFHTDEQGGRPKPRLIGSRVNLKVLKTWIDHCQNSHVRHFKSGRSLPSPTPCLKLIDCETRKIVSPAQPHLNSCKYVALSYVWGSATHTDSNTNNRQNSEFPVDLPKVVEDAMAVALGLQFRYLWVDRYCIPQDNHAVKTSQIEKMDEIYKSAEVTIFATAGNDSSYGLPGVGSRERFRQPRVEIPGRTILWTLQDPTCLIQTSKWMTRGWTYQEAVLSLRRLFFTDQQVYFECDSMSCCEALDGSPEILESKRKGGCYNGNAMFKGIRQESEDIWTHISAYTMRQLTYESDIINGILGIFREYGKFGDAIFHHWGIPVSWLGIIDDSRSKWRTSFLRGLHWTPTEPARRRIEFPSWSWTGWVAPIKQPEHVISPEDGDINFWIECECW